MNWFKRLTTWFRLLRYRWSAEPAEMRYLLGRHFSGGSVLDIGRTAASTAIGCISTSATGTRVVAFEPQPELAEFLSRVQAGVSLGSDAGRAGRAVIAERQIADAPAADALGRRDSR